MTPKQQKRLIFTVALVLGSLTAIGLLIYAVEESANLFKSPTDIVNGDMKPNVQFKLGGMVKEGSVEREEGVLDVKFTLTDYCNDVVVSYNRILPDLFREGQGIVTIGRLNDQGEFIAEEVLAKHDENYMPAEVADSLKGQYDKERTDMSAKDDC